MQNSYHKVWNFGNKASIKFSDNIPDDAGASEIERNYGSTSIYEINSKSETSHKK